MTKTVPLLSVLEKYDKFNKIKTTLTAGKGAVSVFGTSESHRLHMLSALYNSTDSSMLVILPNDNYCLRFEELFHAYGIETIHFPAKTQLNGTSAIAVSGGTEAKRTEQLIKLLHGDKCLVLVSCECLMQRLAPKEVLKNSVIRVNTGDEISMDTLVEDFVRIGYSRCEICDESGTFAVRGGRIDIFPSNSQYPIRIEFFGDEIDTMRSFDPEAQRSIDNLAGFTIYPAVEMPISSKQKSALISKLRRMKNMRSVADDIESGTGLYRLNQMLPLIYENASYIFDYMQNDTIIVLNEPLRLMESAQSEYTLFSENVRTIIESEGGQSYLWQLMSSPDAVMHSLPQQKLIMFSSVTSSFSYINPHEIFQIEALPATPYIGDEDNFLHDLSLYSQNGYSIVVFAGRNAKNINDRIQKHGLKSKFYESLESETTINNSEIAVIAQSMPEGYEYRELRLVVITENELFGLSMHRKQAYSSAATKRSSGADKLLLSKLSVGDYVVHEANGIGRFQGVKEIEVDGKKSDYLILQYAGTDMMYIPCDQLDRIQKYMGNDENPPKLSKLNSSEWKHTVARVKSSVKELAFNLVALYGERMSKTGFAFSKDTPEQIQLESSFPYDETPDQLMSIQEIKRDMESDRIMDRLVCGDVGFGKTEVALRAAFKAVMDCKQVAFLVPTTILAYQHYNTLRSRFASFGVRVDFVSRFKSKNEVIETLTRLKNGEIDVIVGTHRLLSKDVKFADLGLLVIDEEQRFGVGHKESIKELKKTVDVLTLTATPIPRTMHMSLIGIRDISLLDTPPKQRYPVQTFVTEFNPTLIRDAILKELSRRGQVYFLYNNVKNMPSFYSELCKLVPEARISYAHGQMPEDMLESTMLDFIDGKFDVLLSSTIIENGLDVPNANTLIVYNADKFGLSQLYQLRGRVGRSKRIGFAYFTFEKNKVLTEIAEKRLMSIAQFTQLGSGYKIAMRDLQIRGAGDLLGPQQHGHMEEIGYELYRKLVSEAVAEAKGYSRPQPAQESTVEVALDAYIPRTYIKNEEWRLEMYKRISQINSLEDYLDVQDELIDRFGDPPRPTLNVMNIAMLKSLSTSCYITVLTVMENEVRIIFATNAPYNIEKLMSFKQQTGSTLSNENDVIKLHLPEKNKDKAKVCENLKKTLVKLRECIEQR